MIANIVVPKPLQTDKSVGYKGLRTKPTLLFVIQLFAQLNTSPTMYEPPNNMKRRYFNLIIFTVLFLFQKAAFAGEPLALTWVKWEDKREDKESGHRGFKTTTNVPVGSIIRIKVTHIEDRSTHSNETTNLSIGSFAGSYAKPDDGQVLEMKVTTPGPIYLYIAQNPTYNKPNMGTEEPVSSKKEDGGVWTLNWKTSSLQIKVLAAPF